MALNSGRQIEPRTNFLDNPLIPLVVAFAMIATGLLAACLIALG